MMLVVRDGADDRGHVVLEMTNTSNSDTSAYYSVSRLTRYNL